MLYLKNLRTSFISKFLNFYKRKSRKQEVNWSIISKKLGWIKKNTKSTVPKKSNLFYLHAIQPKSQYSILFRKVDLTCCGSPFTCLFNTPDNRSRIAFSVRHYSETSYIQNLNSRRWFIVILCGLTAGLGIGMVLYHDSSKEHSETEPTIIEPTIQPKTLRFPHLPEQIPDEIPYLIIGGGTAAFAAFRAIKSSDPTAKVLVVTNELYYPYMRPPLSKELIFSKTYEEGDEFHFRQWNGRKRSVFFEPEEFYTSCEELMLSENGGVSVARGWSVKQVDHNNKVAILDDGKTIKYEKCLLATGSVPKQLQIFPKGNPDILKKVSYYRTLNEFTQLEDVMNDNTKSVVVIGNGFQGTELACSLAKKGIKVTLMFKEENVLADVLPEYLAKSLTAQLGKQGVNVIHNAEIEQANFINNKIYLITLNGHVVTADHVVVALGMTPNTDLAEGAGLETDETLGGYIANGEFLVRRDLYAAGDCVSFYDTKFGRRRIEDHDHAVISGRLAGENMTGKGKIFKTQSMFWSDIAPELGLEAVGIVDSSLPTIAVYVQNSETDTETKAESSKSINQDDVAQPTEFDRGVIFYLKNKIVVGVVLWNLYNRISIARKVLKSEVAFDDFYEVAKHFKMYGVKT